MKRSTYLSACIILGLVLISTTATAQLGPIGFDDATDIDEAVPINGLIYLALAVGGYLGYKKVK